MTTVTDRGGASIRRVHCVLRPGTGYLPLELALRDMRTVNGRDPDTGDGPGNDSWTGLCLGMIVLDTLSGTNESVGKRFTRLLTEHGIDPEDANDLSSVRNSLLHGYGPPKPSSVRERRIEFTDSTTAYAYDTHDPHRAWLSVPVFCGHLVERITAAVPERWDVSLTAVAEDLIHIGVRYLPLAPSVGPSTQPIDGTVDRPS